MTDSTPDAARIVSASREVAAPASEIFELIADPNQQPRWDGNDNLVRAETHERVRAVGDVFNMTTTKGNLRDNEVVDFAEGRSIAWMPGDLGQPRPGHVWRWDLEPVDETHTVVTHTYDWTNLTDERRFPRAMATTSDKLRSSIDRLADLAENG